MKPAAFRYFAPKTLPEVLALLAEHGDGARILAGGQSLVPLMNLRMLKPDALISINHCPELDYIRAEPDWIAIGAAARQAAGEDSAEIARQCPLLAATLPYVGGAANRNRGTICGSLAHADPLAELPACAIALDAKFVLARTGTTRVVSAEDFFVAELTNCIETGEMLQEVRFPTWRDANLRAAFAEVGNRKHGFALAGVAAQFALDADGRCANVRMAGIGFGPVPRRFRPCEEFLAGKPPSEAAFREAGRMAAELNEGNSDMHADAAYRKAMAGVLTERALNRALNASETV